MTLSSRKENYKTRKKEFSKIRILFEMATKEKGIHTRTNTTYTPHSHSQQIINKQN